MLSSDCPIRCFPWFGWMHHTRRVEEELSSVRFACVDPLISTSEGSVLHTRLVNSPLQLSKPVIERIVGGCRRDGCMSSEILELLGWFSKGGSINLLVRSRQGSMLLKGEKHAQDLCNSCNRGFIWFILGFQGICRVFVSLLFPIIALFSGPGCLLFLQSGSVSTVCLRQRGSHPFEVHGR